MNIQRLEFIVEVAKAGSISIASENLHVSQSGISQAITKIEEELDVRIFNRSRLGATLTNEGKKIVEKSKEILLKYEELKEVAKKSNAAQTSEISVSMVPAFINYLLDPLMEFKNQHSNLTIEILENTTERTIEKVKNNKVDIGVICLYDAIYKEISELTTEEVLEGKMKVYVNNESPFAITKKITPEELLKQKIVLYNGDYIRWFSRNFQIAYGKMNILFTSNHTEEILRTLVYGTAITLGPNFSLKNNPYILDGKLVEVDLVDCENVNVNANLGIVSSKKKGLSKVERQFIKFLKDKLVHNS